MEQLVDEFVVLNVGLEQFQGQKVAATLNEEKILTQILMNDGVKIVNCIRTVEIVRSVLNQDLG